MFSYAMPHLPRIVVVTAFTAAYSAFLTLRLGLIGLLVDGVLTAEMSSQHNSLALRAYQTAARWVGAYEPLRPTYRKEDPFVLLVAKGDFVKSKESYEALQGTLIDLWTTEPQEGTRGDGGHDRAFIRMEVRGRNLAVEGPDSQGVWRFKNGVVAYTTGEALSLTQKQRYIKAFFFIAIFLAIAIGATGFLKDYLSRKVYLHIAADIRQHIFNHLSRQSVAFFDRHKSGDMVSRFLNDAGTVQLFLQYVFDNFLEQPFTIAFSLTVAFLVQPYLTLICLPFLIGLFYPIWRSARRVRKHGKGRLKQLGVVTQSVQQLFSGIRIIKAFSMEEKEQENFAAQNRKYVRVALKMAVSYTHLTLPTKA